MALASNALQSGSSATNVLSRTGVALSSRFRHKPTFSSVGSQFHAASLARMQGRRLVSCAFGVGSILHPSTLRRRLTSCTGRRSLSSQRAAGEAARELYSFLHRSRNQLSLQSPPVETLDELARILDTTVAEDFGIVPQDVGGLIRFQDVFDCPEMNLVIFLLPKGSKLPLHDHPDMHVFGRLLFGRLRATSYDIGEEGEATLALPGARRILSRHEVVHGPHPVTYSLAPHRGNLHELEAIDDVAFFDVLFPPYDFAAGRDCNYYTVRMDPRAREDVLVHDPSVGWRLSMESRPYKGPPFFSE